MKKTLSILLVLALLIGLTPAVMADEEWTTLRVETYDREITGLDVTNCWQLHYAQENFGDPNHIKLEFVSFARWTEGDLLTNALAGGTAPDICLTYNGGLVQQAIDDEGIWQLDDLLNEYGANLKAFLGDELLGYGQSDHDGDGVKEQWFIPARRISVANVGNFIRQDWRDHRALLLRHLRARPALHRAPLHRRVRGFQPGDRGRLVRRCPQSRNAARREGRLPLAEHPVS